MSFPLFAGFLFGAGIASLAWMFYVDTKLKPQLRDAEHRLHDLEFSWSSPWELSKRLSDVSIANRRNAESVRAAEVIQAAVQEALGKGGAL